MDDYSVYNSPFRSSIFETSNHKTVREVYRDRIKQIYYSQFPLLLNSNTQKQIDSHINNIQSEEKAKPLQQENKDTENKEEQKHINTDQKLQVNDPENKPNGTALTKLTKALNLLDIEYFGREQQLYSLLFNKYKKDPNLKPQTEYLPQTYSPPLISELLITENATIECCECLQSYSLSQFPLDEVQNNGYFLACCRCAPDRNNIVSVKWHESYKSDAVILDNNGYIAKVIQSNHKYALGAHRPVLKGIHCWRWCTKQHQSWFLWGISHCKKYTDNSYGNQGVYGIAGSNQSYKNGQCTYDIQTGVFFGGKNKVVIDMLLDLNSGELKFKIPGNDSEAKMVDIPKDSIQGWVPHCNIHYANATVQIKKIPTTWYGKMPKRVKFV